VAGASAVAQPGSSLAPAGWDETIKLREAVDKNPDPNIVEIDLEARLAEVEVAPGKVVKAWTYDGGLPGPLIRTRVGDRLIVHFTNNLDERPHSLTRRPHAPSRWMALPASRSPR
jgi:FtsP/CotA-like multicopper oxidase with cupredoxin domain